MRHLIVVFAMLASAAAMAAGPSPVWVASGFAQPASALYTADKQIVYVSNIDGEPAAKDGKGFISRVAPDGKLIQREWLRGLNAPKGLGYYFGLLYVADIDELLEIDTGNGRIRHRYAAKGAKSLRDVAVDGQGRVYVSDTGTNTIWRLSSSEFTPWVVDAALNGPNGLLLEKGRLVVASSGSGGNDSATGFLCTVDLSTHAVEPRFAPIGFGALDGLAADGRGGYYVSDFAHGNVYHVSAGGENTLWLLLDPATADLGLVPGKLVLVPNTEQGTLSAFALDR